MTWDVSKTFEIEQDMLTRDDEIPREYYSRRQYGINFLTALTRQLRASPTPSRPIPSLIHLHQLELSPPCNMDRERRDLGPAANSLFASCEPCVELSTIRANRNGMVPPSRTSHHTPSLGRLFSLMPIPNCAAVCYPPHCPPGPRLQQQYPPQHPYLP